MNQFFEVRGIPEVLPALPEISQRHITRAEVEIVMQRDPQAIIPVSGDCLEAVKVVNGGWVCVDFTRRPAPPRYKSKGVDGSSDLCCCYAVYPGQKGPAIMLKEYIGVWGPWQMVGTRYDLKKGKHMMNCAFEAKEIFGVVIASWDNGGRLLWKRDPSSFPEELGIAPTIRGENIGDPIPFKVAERV